MTMQIREPVLLTGAGFTRNFGGFLANQMWDKIFNHAQVQSHQSLTNLLKENFNFESVYHEVMDGNGYTLEAQAALCQAVQNAYDQLDNATRNYWGHSASAASHLVSHQGFTRLLEHFASEGRSRGYIFTLNQDLFVERWYSEHGTPPKLLRTPGMQPLAWNPRERCLTPDDYLQVPSDPTEAQKDSSQLLYYVKLHGSINWESSDGRGPARFSASASDLGRAHYRQGRASEPGAAPDA